MTLSNSVSMILFVVLQMLQLPLWLPSGQVALSKQPLPCFFPPEAHLPWGTGIRREGLGKVHFEKAPPAFSICRRQQGPNKTALHNDFSHKEFVPCGGWAPERKSIEEEVVCSFPAARNYLACRLAVSSSHDNHDPRPLNAMGRQADLCPAVSPQGNTKQCLIPIPATHYLTCSASCSGGGGGGGRRAP